MSDRSPILSLDDVPDGKPDKTQWTVIIPAAGTGSRLGFDKAKILYPLLGRPILDWLLDALEDVSHRVILVIAPRARSQVEPVFFDRMGDRGLLVTQSKPTGMGDAVLCAEGRVMTPHCLVVWGDQALLSRRTIRCCALAHEKIGNPKLTLATLWKKAPYIHFQRDSHGKLVRVLQAREGEIDSLEGENDCGLFLFNTQALFATLHRCRDTGLACGTLTGEFNLLQTLPSFEEQVGDVVTVRITDERETLGVNTPGDAKMVEQILANIHASAAAL
ncbi:MAG: NTP transferase domain-containing protein [Magnetococcales bacterium]|nr:NTP transferase domain-containing protein [Magnetococcales bacterium]